MDWPYVTVIMTMTMFTPIIIMVNERKEFVFAKPVTVGAK